MSEELLALRLCTVIDSAGETVRPYVRCPRRSETIDALACMGCERMGSVEWDAKSGGAITCNVETISKVAIDRRADLAETAARTPVHAIIPPLATCLGSELSVGEAREIVAAKGLHVIGVADAEGKVLGVVTRAELQLAGHSRRLSELVPANGHSLLADAPIGHAIALMAVEGLAAVPCVTADGKLLGVCEASEVLRWVAKNMGLVAPETNGRGPHRR